MNNAEEVDVNLSGCHSAGAGDEDNASCKAVAFSAAAELPSYKERKIPRSVYHNANNNFDGNFADNSDDTWGDINDDNCSCKAIF